MNQTINPAGKIQGKITLPGDKSISHRALIFACLARGDSQINNLSIGKDVTTTMQCLSSLGIKIERDKLVTVVHGKGLHSLKKPLKLLDAENSGTTMRLLSGVLAAQTFDSILTGDDSLRRRPMARIVTPLRLMGAKIETKGNTLAPLKFYGKKLTPIHYESPVASAQIKSCILLAGLFSKGIVPETPSSKYQSTISNLLILAV